MGVGKIGACGIMDVSARTRKRVVSTCDFAALAKDLCLTLVYALGLQAVREILRCSMKAG